MLNAIKRRNNSYNTFKIYWRWCVKYMIFCKQGQEWVDPVQCGAAEIEAFLSHLAVDRNVSPTTQNQAFAAVLYLYRNVLDIDIQGVNAVRAKTGGQSIPIVLNPDELARIFNVIKDPARLANLLQYGGGTRISETLALRVKDVDLHRHQLTLWRSKGYKSRVTMFAPCIAPLLQVQIERARHWWQIDQQQGNLGVSIPHAYGRKNPTSNKSFAWYYLFCSPTLSQAPTGRDRGWYRHHLHSSGVSRQLAAAVKLAGISKRVTTHTFRHTWASHSLEQGVNIKVIQELLGHSDLNTTMIYTHINKNAAADGSKSPLERLVSQPTRLPMVDRLRSQIVG